MIQLCGQYPENGVILPVGVVGVFVLLGGALLQ